MVYAKKLIVLSGIGGKGTVTLERSAAGLECRLTTYNLPDLRRGKYALAVFADRTRVIELGSLGRVNVRVSLDADTRIDGIHFAVAEVADEVKIRLYGTNAPAALWEGNMIDVIRKKTERREPPAQMPAYSGRRLEDYFFDILPPAGEYHDSAVAGINFYSPDFDPERPDPSLVGPKPAPPAAGNERAFPDANAVGNERAFSDPSLVGPKPAPSAVGNERAFSDANAVGNERAFSDASGEKTGPERETGLPAEAIGGRADGPAESKVKPEREDERENGARTRAYGRAPSELEREYILRLSGFSSLKVPDEPPAFAAAQAEPANKEEPEKAALRKAAASRDVPKVGAGTAARIREVTFYEQAAPQIETLFKEYPRHAELEKLMPDTKWVRVDFDGKSYYAVGLVGAKPDFVCYAVPAAFTPEPPEELDGYAVWVPQNASAPEGEGYWVMYQDGVTGESVRRR